MHTPVTVLTGFLGAGKTTLLNRMVTEPHGRRYAIIVNEFADLSIDADLILAAEEEIIELNNGCLCCSIRDDLVRVLASLLARRDAFDAILIETSGVADPTAIAQTLLLDDVHRFERLRFDAIITVIDACNVREQMSQSRVSVNQIAAADVMLLNKIDLVDPSAAEEIEAGLRTLNPSASLHRTSHCAVPLALLLDRSAYALDAPISLQFTPLPQSSHAHHWAGDAVSSVSLRSLKLVDPDDFLQWMEELMREKGPDILRSKGILAFADEPRRFVFHGVQRIVDGDLQREWRPGESRESRLVFIGRNLDRDALTREFEACLR